MWIPPPPPPLVCSYICVLLLQMFTSFSVEKQVKEIMHRAFWDVFQEKITEEPPDYSQAVVLIQEVKEVTYH